jgi:sulfite exporter TauE/SafE
MWILLGTVFVASLLGSLHCVGMCGPFALMASSPRTHGLNDSLSSQRQSALVPTAAYSLGRLVTYSIVGAVFGSLGMALNQGVEFASYQQAATYVAGGLMVLVGCVALARQLGFRIQLPSIAGPLQTFLQKHFQKITRQPPLRRALLIGAFSCLMPCGWLYTFAIVAAGTGSPWQGVVVMSVFWAGTVPIMVALTLGLSRLGQSFQKKLPLVMASLVILIGVFTIAYRAPIVIGENTKVVDQTEDLITQVNQVDQEELPCCQDD